MLDATAAREVGDRDSDVPPGRRAPVRRHLDLRTLDVRQLATYAVLYAGCIALGRLSLQPETGLAFFWPAAGVGLLWALICRSRADLVACLVAIFVIATVGNSVTGTAWLPGTVLGVANVVMVLLPRLLLRLPDAPWRRRWHLPPWSRLNSAGSLVQLLLAVAAGSMASGAVGMVGVALLGGEPGWVAWLSWITRNGAAAVVIAFPLLACPVFMGEGGSQRELAQWLWTSRRAELATLLVLTVAVEWWVFGPGGGLPLTFLPFALVAWAGLRFPPLLAGLHGSMLAVATLVLVLVTDGGPIGEIVDPGRQAFTLQSFMVLTVALALLVALVIAERDALSARLTASERHARERAVDLETITDTIPEGLVVMRADGRPVRANRAAQQMLGEDVGRYFDNLREVHLRRLDGEPVPAEDRPAAQALAGRTVRDLRLLMDDPRSGEDRVWSFTAVPLLGPDGRTHDRAVVLFRDVTDEHERTTQLENFAGVVAHDLQNPITAIEGWTHVLADALDDLDPEDRAGTRKALSHVQRATRRGTQLIGDLLDYSVARTSDINPAPVDLDRLVEQLAETMTSADPERGTRISHRDLGSVTADPVLMRQLFANLIGNAVKYTPPGREPRVDVGAQRTNGHVRLTVTDNGVGIPAASRDRIFEPFHRAHSGDARFTGTGLGLAICARAVERHGGTLEVDDNPGGPGTRFTVSLPA
ncbi:ATP-binding protein [Nocardioides coralli]|uniref:ATP-binding protein n=1 Tax=Nocardioides coralli TaxID=2872154 RepID=UPI001CA3DC66|nr:ATP-binding protein [Nocardioides coralli]QZY29287.1 PAS domain-containing protein [Nocardioides coralli]